MSQKITNIILWLIIVLSFLVKVYRFGSIPVTLNRDEAALGYNAFAIANYGQDEWRQSYPVTFKSFGDYKLPGYIYLDSLLIKLFGVHDWAIRLPSLAAGLLITVLTYLILMQWFKNHLIALTGTALFSSSPWSIFYTRMAFEAHVGLSLFLLGLYLLHKHQKKYVILGLFSLLAAAVTYNSPLILLPVLIVCFLIKKEFFKSAGILIICIIGALLVLPATSQKQGISIFSDPTMIDYQAKQFTKQNTFIGKVWWHKYSFYIRETAVRFANSWNPAFLTVRGGANPWHTIPSKAHLYWTTYILVFIGLYGLTKFKTSRLNKISLFFLIVSSLMPAVITVDAPHATRSLFFLWLLPITAAVGFKTLPKITQPIVLIIVLIEFFSYSYSYFVSFPQFRSIAWPVGLKASLISISDPLNKTINISGDGSDLTPEQIYIYPLLYWQVSPITYQHTARIGGPDNAGMIRTNGFQNLDISQPRLDRYDVVITRNKDGSYEIKH